MGWKSNATIGEAPLKHPEFCYRDVAFGSPKFRNTIVRAEEVALRLPPDRRECYATIARYPEAFIEYFNSHKKSVEGYAGPVMVDTFWIDVDAMDLEHCLDQARTLYLTLAGIYGCGEHIRIYFSGKKGFHLGVPTELFGVEPGPFVPPALKGLARRVAEQSGVELDLSIYTHVSLLRWPNTINAKAVDLYKIPLTWDDMCLSIEEIKALAKAPRKVEVLPLEGATSAPLTRLYAEKLAEAERGVKERVELPVLQVNDGLLPKRDKVCVYRMLKGVGEGWRNKAALRLAVHFRQKGFPFPIAHAAMGEWNRHNEPSLDEADLIDVARRGYEHTEYDFGCQDDTLDHFCHKSCYIYPQKIGAAVGVEGEIDADILSVGDLHAKYLAMMRNREQAKVTWGLEWLDRQTRMLGPGQVGIVMARAGVGKTALGVHILRANSQRGNCACFFSLEMPGAEVYERMASSAMAKPGLEIEAGFVTGDEEFIAATAAMTGEEFRHCYVCERTRLSVADLVQYVRIAEEKAGQKVRLVLVDYFGLLRGEGKDLYQRASELATGLKSFAKRVEAAVIVVVQLNRMGKSGGVEVTLDMARDSGQIEEAADYAVGLWKVNGDEPGRSSYPVMVRILKNRKGPAQIEQAFEFQADKMRFEDPAAAPRRPAAVAAIGEEDPFIDDDPPLRTRSSP